MSDTTPKRDARVHYDAALESWRAALVGVCPACHDAGTIHHEDGELPCPLCDPVGARKAASS